MVNVCLWSRCEHGLQRGQTIKTTPIPRLLLCYACSFHWRWIADEFNKWNNIRDSFSSLDRTDPDAYYTESTTKKRETKDPIRYLFSQNLAESQWSQRFTLDVHTVFWLIHLKNGFCFPGKGKWKKDVIVSLCLSNRRCYPWLETDGNAAGCLVGLYAKLTDALHHKFRGGFTHTSERLKFCCSLFV